MKIENLFGVPSGFFGMCSWIAVVALMHGLAVRQRLENSDARVVEYALTRENQLHTERWKTERLTNQAFRVSSRNFARLFLVAFYPTVWLGIVLTKLLLDWSVGRGYGFEKWHFLGGSVGLFLIPIRLRSLSRWLRGIEQQLAQMGVSVESIPTNVLAATRESV